MCFKIEFIFLKLDDFIIFFKPKVNLKNECWKPYLGILALICFKSLFGEV